jgi:ABC-type glycerol-3-phosphate transport system substrate-binding protein
MRRLAMLAVVTALAGCGSTGATTKAANCLEKVGWKVDGVSAKKLEATRVHAGLTWTLTYRPPAQPVIEIPSASTPTYDPKTAACFR